MYASTTIFSGDCPAVEPELNRLTLEVIKSNLLRMYGLGRRTPLPPILSILYGTSVGAPRLGAHVRLY